MDCQIIPEISYKDFNENIYRKLIRDRVPLSGSLELTSRCNMNCVHCYVSCERNQQSIESELDFPKIAPIIDEMTDNGTLFLLLTGGEPLIREDFLDIYTYIREKGVMVSLFTNGTLITNDIIRILRSFPPAVVEITLYGATQETYESVTQRPGSFQACMKGIDLLLNNGINLRLKTVVIKPNQHELDQMKGFAKRLGLNFRYDALVTPCLNGDKKPYDFRLPLEEAIKYDLHDSNRRAFWETLLQTGVTNTEYLWACGAASKTFHIDPHGKLSACLLTRSPSYDLLLGSFYEGWYDFLYQNIRQRKPKAGYKCAKCKLISICDQCPGWSQIENGNEETPISYLCELAHLRARGLDLII